MVMLVARGAPTVGDAARAAEAIAAADPGIVRVVVYGSVAKQSQDDDSDIDIVAITSSTSAPGEGHEAARYGLRQAAEAACGIRCDVLLINIGEWEWVAEHARSSVFGEARAHGLTLWERPCPPAVPSAGECLMARDDWLLAIADLRVAGRKNRELARTLKSIPRWVAEGEWGVEDRQDACESMLEVAHMSIERSLLALGRLHLRRYLDNHHNIDAMAHQLRLTPSGSFVEALLGDLDTAEKDGKHTNWRFSPYFGSSDSFRVMITPENTADHIGVAAGLIEHAITCVEESPMRHHPVPTYAANTLTRAWEPIGFLRRHATPDYLREGVLPRL
ncbi:nucleotidyltransferase domain-containing protein [Candidatus Poriferisocius sp.]|uniref:nucleotidyltransferase domain-containing protein n=1 Tax=Candidatus Poriferisocius sp. TaxID=3101276 RepID=UPI003B02D336